jgi:hypothetical protein
MSNSVSGPGVCFSGTIKHKCEGCDQEFTGGMMTVSDPISNTLVRFCGACMVKAVRWALKGAVQAERNEAAYKAICDKAFVAEEGESDLSMAKRMLGLPE